MTGNFTLVGGRISHKGAEDAPTTQKPIPKAFACDQYWGNPFQYSLHDNLLFEEFEEMYRLE